MALKVIWTNFAKNELRQIFDYYHQKVNFKIAQKIALQIVEKTKSIEAFPEIGAVDELLSALLPQEFRFIVSTNYKIIYWINKEKNRIEIVDVFDTRQNPIKLSRNK